MSLSLRVKERRKALKLTQVRLAQLSGVRQQTINLIEKGKIIRPRRLLEISVALECEQLWLLTGKTCIKKATPCP